MSIEAISAAMGALGGPASAGAAAPASPVQAGYGVSLTDVGHFQQAMDGAAARLEARATAPQSEGLRNLVKPLGAVDGEAAELSAAARAAESGGHTMTPGEVVALTVRSSEFLFHCQLTSNIANRTSDGLQQLFRQQS